jgi:hypothetical protein
LVVDDVRVLRMLVRNCTGCPNFEPGVCNLLLEVRDDPNDALVTAEEAGGIPKQCPLPKATNADLADLPDGQDDGWGDADEEDEAA